MSIAATTYFPHFAFFDAEKGNLARKKGLKSQKKRLDVTEEDTLFERAGCKGRRMIDDYLCFIRQMGYVLTLIGQKFSCILITASDVAIKKNHGKRRVKNMQ